MRDGKSGSREVGKNERSSTSSLLDPPTESVLSVSPSLRPSVFDRTAIGAARWARRVYDRVLAPPVWPKVLVVLAMAVGAILRLVDLHDLPPGFHQDEAIYAYEAYSLALTGRDHAGHPLNLVGFESFGDWVPPVIVVLLAPFVGVFGLHVVLVRAVIAVVGVAAIPLVFFLGRAVADRRAVGVIAAWLLALSPWHIHQSRWETVPSIAPTVTALGLLLLIRALRCRSDRLFVWAAVAMSLALASYQTLRLYVPLVLLGSLPWFWRTYLRFRPGTLALGGGIGLFVAGPLVWFSLKDPAGRGRLEQISVFTKNSIYLPAGTKVDLPFLWRQYRDYVSLDFLFRRGDGRLDSPPGGGVELWTALPFLLIGVAALLWAALPRVGGSEGRRVGENETRTRVGRFLLPSDPPTLRPSDPGAAGVLLVALFAAPIPGALTLPSPHVLRATHVMPLLAITAAIGVVTVWDVGVWLGRWPGVVWRVGQGIALLGLVAGAVALPIELNDRYHAYFDDYRTAGGSNFQYGAEPAVRYALDHAAEYDQIWISGMPEPYAYILFFGQWDPVDVHARLQIIRNPPWFNGVAAFDKYAFQEAPPALVNVLPVLETVRTPDGRPVFEVRGGTDQNGRRQLVVRRIG